MKRTTTSSTGEYVTGEHFRKLFAEHVNILYLLSFLLTAHHEKAEQCFVAGLDDCVTGSPVFREWAQTWARRIIVKNAVRMIAPRIGRAATAPAAFISPDSGPPTMSAQDAPFSEILALGDFERFIYILTVLERYSDQDCAMLLGVSRQEVRDGRTRAFRQIAHNSHASDVQGVICQMR